MNSEKEIWSRISQENFDLFFEKLKGSFEAFTQTKRLAIQATDYDRQDVDTRIRITDGTAEIMQKKGGWGDETRIEISTPLESHSNTILSAYKIIRNMLTGTNIETSIIQTENFIFKNDVYEIKLTHQFGKTDAYNYEIEVYDHSLEPLDIVQEIGIPIDSPENTPEFWKEWNNAVNLIADSLSDEELIAIIQTYI